MTDRGDPGVAVDHPVRLAGAPGPFRLDADPAVRAAIDVAVLLAGRSGLRQVVDVAGAATQDRQGPAAGPPDR